jgi:hypothetical protein
MPRNAKAYEIERLRPGDKVAPGAYWFMTMPEGHEDAGIVMGIQHGCPCGCGARSALFFKSYTGDDGWTIEKPFPEATLSPSIGMFRGQNPYHWHGYLRDGVFVEC